MYKVIICNNSGRSITWDVFYKKETAERERELLINENNFWPDDVFVEKISNY